eukprot:403333405
MNLLSLSNLNEDKKYQTQTASDTSGINGRHNRFAALAETSFKSPSDIRGNSFLSKSPLDETQTDNGSKRRRLSHSPVSVNTTYELSEHNTDKLWEKFQNRLQNRANAINQLGGGRQSLSNPRVQRINDNNYQDLQYGASNTSEIKDQGYQPLRKNFPENIKNLQEFRSNSKEQQPNQDYEEIQVSRLNMKQKAAMHHHPSFGDQEFLQQSASQNKQIYENYTNQINFASSQISDDKNQLLLGSKLKELFKISKEDTQDLVPNSTHQYSSFSQEQNIVQQNQKQFIQSSYGSFHQRPNEEGISVLSPGSLKATINQQQIIKELSPQNQQTQSYGQMSYSKQFVGTQETPQRSQSNFKDRVQQRIAQMQSELKNPASLVKSPSRNDEDVYKRQDDYRNLDDYLSQQNQIYFQTYNQPQRNNQQSSLFQNLQQNNSLSSLSHQTEQFNKTTSRFNNYMGTQGTLLDPLENTLGHNVYNPNQFLNQAQSFDDYQTVQSRRPGYNDKYKSNFLQSLISDKNQLIKTDQSELENYQNLRMRSQEKLYYPKQHQYNDFINMDTKQQTDDFSSSNILSEQKSRQQSQNKKHLGIKRSTQNNSSRKSSIFNHSTLKKSKNVKISEEPYFYKNWTQQKEITNNFYDQTRSKKSDTINTDSKNRQIGNMSYVDSLNESVLKQKSKERIDLGTSQTEDCRRIMFNMVNGIRQQQRSRQSSQNIQSDKENIRQKVRSRSPIYSSSVKSNYELVLREQQLDIYSQQNQSTPLFSNKFNNVKDQIQHLLKQSQQLLFQIQQKAQQDSKIQELLTKILTVEKLLKQIYSMNDQTFVFLRLYSAFLLISLYNFIGDHQKITKYLEQNTKSYMNLKQFLEHLLKKHKLKKELSNYILQIYKFNSKALLSTQKYSKAVLVLSDISKLYDRWRTNQYTHMLDQLDVHIKNEFGIDDYIESRSSEAECLMQLGKLFEAVDKFESVKSQIEKELVFDKPLIYINICNQLGNCYLKIDDQTRALENFETSLSLINKLEDKSQVSDLIVSKICQNIALISGQKGYVNDFIKMSEKSLTIKLNVLPQFHNEVLTSQIQCANSYDQAGDYERSCQYLEKAFQTCKNTNGEYDLQTAEILIQLATAYELDSQFSESIKRLEHACVIMKRIEKQKIHPEFKQKEIITNVNKILLKLIDMYLQVNQIHQNGYNTIQIDDELSYKLLNETANILRKHNNTICLKNKYKNTYLDQFDTSKILINIASCEYMRQNYQEALKYYEHALQVVMNQKGLIKDSKESAKLQMQIGRIQSEIGNFQMAQKMFQQAIQGLERTSTKNDCENHSMLVEANYALRQLYEKN